jgi:DNA replication protein DnaC
MRRSKKRQQKLERHRQGHAAKMAQLDEEIRQVKERTLEAQLSRDMKLALEQKQRDLENMKTLAAQSLNGSTKSANAVMSLPHHKSSLPERNRASASAPSSAAQVERTFDPDIQEEQVQSPSEKEWDRQKQQENVSSDAIDSLMAMTGLEQVKAQFLRIKAKIETALRQSTKLNKERFGIVLLGNPGTG